MTKPEPTLTGIRDPAVHPQGRAVLALELAAAFALGAALMTFLYSGTGGPSGGERGLPGNDDFYHVKMAMLMPRIGLPDQFPWLTTTIFSERFVNHHWGFQALMAPFIALGERLRGDPLVGARWAITAFFALAVTLFDLLLITERVRFRWMWLGLFLVMPAQFFGRQVFVRAISLSLVCMFGILLLMFRGRYVWCALLIAAYVHVYLGALCYVPLLVGGYVLSGLAGTDEEDRVSWKLPLWAAVGLAVGWLTHPYRDGVFDFLRVQVFGSGLTPEISVGREWKSYEGPLWSVVFEQFGGTLSLLVAAIIARMRMGGRLNARESAALLVNFAFLTLAVRQRRFIEYWPPFGLLASAMLVGPLLGKFRVSSFEFRAKTGFLLAVAVWGAAVWLLRQRGAALELGSLLRHWPFWAGLVALVALPAFHGAASSLGGMRPRPLVSGLCAAAVTALTLLPVMWVFRETPATRGTVWVALPLLGVIVVGAAALFRAAPASVDDRPRTRRTRGLISAAGTFGGAAFAILLLLGAGPQIVGIQRSSRCSYDLPAIRAAMNYLQSVSPPDSIVFTDDWDVFPVYFYHNHHNRFIVGLDPMFSHSHDPLLYARYVKLTQSKKFPVTAEADVPDGKGGTEHRTAEVNLADIRDQFHAEYVIVDPDHKGIGQHLEKAPDLAERVFPAEERVKDKWPPYTIYRIRGTKE